MQQRRTPPRRPPSAALGSSGLPSERWWMRPRCRGPASRPPAPRSAPGRRRGSCRRPPAAAPFPGRAASARHGCGPTAGPGRRPAMRSGAKIAKEATIAPQIPGHLPADQRHQQRARARRHAGDGEGVDELASRSANGGWRRPGGGCPPPASARRRPRPSDSGANSTSRARSDATHAPASNTPALTLSAPSTSTTTRGSEMCSSPTATKAAAMMTICSSPFIATRRAAMRPICSDRPTAAAPTPSSTRWVSGIIRQRGEHAPRSAPPGWPAAR